MRGTILGYEAGTGQGVITGSDGQRIKFDRSGWKSPGEPMTGKPVDFELHDEKAADIYAVPGTGPSFDLNGQDPAKQAMTFGIVSLASAILSCALGPLGIITLIIAVVFGIKGKNIGRGLSEQTGYYLSIAGLVISGLCLVIVIGALTACAGFLGLAGGSLGALG